MIYILQKSNQNETKNIKKMCIKKPFMNMSTSMVIPKFSQEQLVKNRDLTAEECRGFREIFISKAKKIFEVRFLRHISCSTSG